MRKVVWSLCDLKLFEHFGEDPRDRARRSSTCAGCSTWRAQWRG